MSIYSEFAEYVQQHGIKIYSSPKDTKETILMPPDYRIYLNTAPRVPEDTVVAAFDEGDLVYLSSAWCRDLALAFGGPPNLESQMDPLRKMLGIWRFWEGRGWINEWKLEFLEKKMTEMELPIPLEEPDSVLSIPRQHLAKRGSWIATVTGQPLDPRYPHWESPRKIALSLAAQIDSTFSVDRTFFSTKTLLEGLEQSHPGEIYYFEDLNPSSVLGGLSLINEIAYSIRDLLFAARRRGVGLILVTPAPDPHLSLPIRINRNSAILVRAVDESLLAYWFECRKEVLNGKVRHVMRYPVIKGEPILRIRFSLPPEDLLRECESRAENYREARHQEMLTKEGGPLQ